MTDLLRHRGPDDTGLSELTSSDGKRCGTFGHRRLSIIDLSSGGHQPMWSSDGNFGITYNGLIYNYLELRDELRAEGVSFRSNCDTEVIRSRSLKSLGTRLQQDFLASLGGMVIMLPLLNIESDFSLTFGGLLLDGLAIWYGIKLIKRWTGRNAANPPRPFLTAWAQQVTRRSLATSRGKAR